jgi:hypothetical protein
MKAKTIGSRFETAMLLKVRGALLFKVRGKKD